MQDGTLTACCLQRLLFALLTLVQRNNSSASPTPQLMLEPGHARSDVIVKKA
jgi:hypothetical protein